uniref:Uncharacterized protein n=1 Tax=Alexandrium andersonii TaxID=327968 RepID=A0A7S2HR33_9DINO|mmetsp:Transcript_74045/g.165696  ORF Transcript_74045/g.165696 Transcript_74045/m.165696 type:complete len:114 (+) Transcript_74045:56-397(+)
MSAASTFPTDRSTPLWSAWRGSGEQWDLPADYRRKLEELWQYNYNVPLRRMVLGSDGQRYDIDFSQNAMRNSETQETLFLRRLGGPHLVVFLGGQSNVAKTAGWTGYGNLYGK